MALTLLTSAVARAQDTAEQTEQQHDMSQMDMSPAGWMFMQDGTFNALFNHQGGPRGGDEMKAPNWWMGMLSRQLGAGQLTLNGMFSVDPLTAGKRGYRELFQAGEAVDGRPNVDHQHPHDVFMQVSATWRAALSDTTSVMLTAAPAGEPALGPVAYMHRASAAAIVFAPLGHHTFDSTHISFGVITAGLARGRWAAEASAFNGREPDADRWGFDLARLDSVSGRLWFRPTEEWTIQVSTGRLVHPEELEPGNVQRTTASTSWTRVGPDSMSAMTIGYGRNDEAGQQAMLAEFTRQRGSSMFSSRFEFVQIAHELLVDDTTASSTSVHANDLDPVAALTVGGLRRLGRWHGLETGVGVNVTGYAVPRDLRASHGAHPFSFQLFVQVRPRVAGMGPMWNMRMGE
jgi:hypothetical protein